MADSSYKDVVNAIEKPLQPENNPWPDRLNSWKKYSEKMHDRGSKIEQRYEDERDSANMVDGVGMAAGSKRVNLFYSNTSVIKESLYNSLPKPDVSRLHRGDFENDPARVAATIIERALSYEVRCAHWFDPAVKSAILDRLVPGIGTLWINFVPIMQKGARQLPESITVDTVYWRDFIFEPQRTWEQVTWCGRKLHLDKAEAKKRWGAAALELPKEQTGGVSQTEQAMASGKTCVIEMWDKNTYNVVYMTPQGTVLQTVPDPYQLLNFFPCPRPLIASPPTRTFLPLSDYYMAQDQYLELDILYGRINLIIEAVRVAGVYDSSVPEIGRMLSGAENKLIPVDNWAMFADKGGTKGVIDWFPVEQVATVLTQLVSTFEFIKNQLFEVTGMADIIRGSSNQYETLGAQQIKAQFASVRMNAFQRDVSTFVRDSMRIIAEMVCQLYTDNKLAMIVGNLPPGDDQFLPQALQIIRDDFMLKYNVDIEADSLTQSDWALQQGQRMEYAQSLSQFLTATLPAAQQDPTLLPLMIQVVKFISVGFKGSSELESMLDSTMRQLEEAAKQQAQQPPQPTPEEIKAQGEQKKIEGQLAVQQARTESINVRTQADVARNAAEIQHAQQMHAMDMQFKREEHMMDLAFEREKNQQKMQLEGFRGAQEAAQNSARFEHERAQDDLRLADEIRRNEEEARNQPKKPSEA